MHAHTADPRHSQHYNHGIYETTAILVDSQTKISRFDYMH
jgi:hypothetical protein